MYMYSLEPITGLLGHKNAGHLLRRATFGPTNKNINDFAQLTVDEAVDILCQDKEEPSPPIDPLTGEDWVSPKPGPNNSQEFILQDYYMAWHMQLMRNETPNVCEKIVWFYHAHMPVSSTKVEWSTPIYYQNKLFRYYALGSFKELFTKLIIDNAMLWYLDNTLNYASDPNENFAREMLELYTIGKGPQIAPGDYTNYTENDVKEAARVLTGWIVDFELNNYDPDLLPETNIAQGYVYTVGDDNLAVLHDAGIKYFSDKFQNTQIQPNEIISGYATKTAVKQELNQLMDMIFNQDETARFLVRKIYRQFVYYKITDAVEQEIIEPLSQTLRENNYSISTVLKQLFKSKYFYDADNSASSDNIIGSIIKSPLDLMMGTIKFFNIQFPQVLIKNYELHNILIAYLQIMGIDFYKPEDVAGFPAYFQEPNYNRNWITSTNLAYRYYMIWPFIEGVKNDNDEVLAQIDIVGWVSNTDNISNPADPTILINELTSGLFASELPPERTDYFLVTVFLEGLPLYYWTNEWAAYLSSGNNEIVKALLNRLLWGLMQSPEAQLF